MQSQSQGAGHARARLLHAALQREDSYYGLQPIDTTQRPRRTRLERTLLVLLYGATALWMLSLGYSAFHILR